MAEDLNLQTKLSSTADTSGATQMSEGLGGVGTVAGVVKTQVEELMAAFGALFAMSELISFFKDSVEAAYELEKSLRAVALAADLYGGNVASLTKEMKDWSETMGVAYTTSIPAVTSALALQYARTGDLEQAQHRLYLALALGQESGKGFEYGMKMVNAAVLGQARAVAQLVPGVRGLTGAHEISRVAMEGLEKIVAAHTKATNDNALAADQAKIRWEHFKETIGEAVAPAITNFKKSLELIPEQFAHIAAVASRVWTSITDGAKAAGTLLVDVWKNPKAAWDQFTADMIAADKRYTASVVTEAGAQVAARAAAEKKIADAVAKAQAERLKTDVIEAKAAKEVGETRLAHFNEENEQEVKVERLREAEDIARKARGILREKKDFDARIAEADKEAKALEEIKKKSIKVRAELDKVDFENFRATQKAKFGLEAQVASQSLSLAADVFGGNKEIAIAEAVINTAAAAVKALANGGGWPAGALMMALTIASGLAEIAVITSSSAPTMPGISADSVQVASGVGFDDPSNDQAAYLGGRKWAGDMIGKFTGGASSVSQGWAGGMGGSTTNNNSSSHVTNINVAGGLLNPSDRESMKQFGRKLAIAMQSDSQRTIARRT